MKAKYNKYILVFIFFVFISFSSSISKIENSYKKGECIILPQQDTDSSWQKITFIKTPSKIIEINQNMTKNDTYYTFVFCDTNETGEYIVNGISDNSLFSSWAYSFYVDKYGKLKDTSLSIGQFILLTILIFFIICCSVLSYFLLKTKFSLLGVLVGIFTFLVFVGLLFFGLEVSGYYNIGENLLIFILYVIIISILPVFILILVYLVFKWRDLFNDLVSSFRGKKINEEALDKTE